MLKNDVLSWALTILLVIVILAAIVMAVVYFGHWMEPRLKNAQKGQKAVKGHVPCCPPGLGCNDPDQGYRKCQRLEASKHASVDDLLELNALWSKFSGSTGRARTKNLALFAAKRDMILAMAVRAAADQLNNRQVNLGLPQVAGVHSGATNGVVVDEPARQKAHW